MRKKLIIALSVLLFIMFGVLAYDMFSVVVQYEKAKIEYNLYNSAAYIDKTVSNIDSVNISPIKNTELPEVIVKDKYYEQIKIQQGINWNAFRNINEDFIGIISIPDLNVWYPLVQNRESDYNYYLTHTYSKSENVSGAIFLDYSFQKDFSDNHSIIFGHNMKNLTMFGILKSLNENHYDRDIYIYIYTRNQVCVYKIYSSYLTEPDSMDYWTTFPKDDDYVSYYNNAIAKADYKRTGKDIDEAFYNRNELLTLSTCHASDHKNYTVVQSILIERIKIEDE